MDTIVENRPKTSAPYQDIDQKDLLNEDEFEFQNIDEDYKPKKQPRRMIKQEEKQGKQSSKKLKDDLFFKKNQSKPQNAYGKHSEREQNMG